jgi:CheY-like chemotaxis protein
MAGSGADVCTLALTHSEYPPGGPHNAQPARVLIVDDNRDAADSLALLMEAAGHVARAAYGGPEALRVAVEHRPDVVFVDIGMPGMNGYELGRRLRQEPATQDALLVAVTGYGRDEDRRTAREAGIDLYFLKPVEPGALCRLVVSRRPHVVRVSASPSAPRDAAAVRESPATLAGAQW